MLHRLSLVTGVDAGMFSQLLLLGGSLRRYSPGLALHVCDFGLTEAQRAYVRRRYVLLDKPAEIRARHPWDYKANLGRYVAAVPCDAFVWIDADMIVLDDIQAPLQALFHAMRVDGHVVAVADSGVTIGEHQAMEPAPSYAILVSGFDPSAPYLNSGFFLCSARGFLDVWAAQTAIMNFEKLYEQNAFNLTVLGSRRQVRILDRFRWNLVANELPSANIEISPGHVAITGPAGPVLILHATSTKRSRDLVKQAIAIEVNGRPFTTTVRMIRNPPALLSLQHELTVEAIQSEGAALVECGVWP
jgi:hypothetical protein